MKRFWGWVPQYMPLCAQCAQRGWFSQQTNPSGFLPGFLPFFCRSRHVIGMCERVFFFRFSTALPNFFQISSVRKRIWPCRKVFGRKFGRAVEKRQPGTCRYTAVFGIFDSKIVPNTATTRQKIFLGKKTVAYGQGYSILYTYGNYVRKKSGRNSVERSPIQGLVEPYVA